jgi:RNA polymerase sigma-70 factor, ECF subfamily
MRCAVTQGFATYDTALVCRSEDFHIFAASTTRRESFGAISHLGASLDASADARSQETDWNKLPQSDVLRPSAVWENAMSEALLLKSIARGDQRAFEEIYRRYYRRLARFLAKRIPPSHGADEIINDTLLIVWQHASEFHYSSQVSTWPFGIAHRVALKSLRKHRLWLRSTTADELSDAVLDPTRKNEERQWLAEGLRRLPDKQRLSLVLTYHFGHSVEQVALMTECPVGTMKARMFHARRQLRFHLDALQ